MARPIWVSIGCCGPCECQWDDDASAWPELPTSSPDAVVAYLLEHGCPDCGSLDLEPVAAGWADDDDD